MAGPNSCALKAMSKRFKCAITLEDVIDDPAQKLVRVAGAEVAKVGAAAREVCTIRDTAPPSASRPLVPAGSGWSQPGQEAVLMQMQWYTEETAAAWAVERRAGLEADEVDRAKHHRGFMNLTVAYVAKWSVDDVQHWARTYTGCTDADASKITLDGAALMAFPIYPTDELEAALVGAGVSAAGAAGIALRYIEQWCDM